VLITEDLGPVRFGEGTPFTVGVEEELFVVDPFTGLERNCSAEVVARADPPARGAIARELHACQVELITDVCATAGEAAGVLADLRAGVVASTGAGLLASGTHPTAEEGDAEITDKARYERIHALLGDAVATPVAGLHVHVGMPDAQTAVRVFNGLRRELPLLQALGANSPFRHGRDTGLASSREVTMAAWPRSGVPRALRDFDEFCVRSAVLAQAADVPDYTFFWWKLRPHPRLGTVELRALDVQTTPEDTAALVALVHVLARELAERAPEGPEPMAEILEEGTFRAARFGVRATLPDADGHLRPVGELLDAVLRRTSGLARELGCEEQLARLPELVRGGGGADRQREVAERSGIDGLLRRLTAATARPPG
jgi:carboxylate-amine ligase